MRISKKTIGTGLFLGSMALGVGMQILTEESGRWLIMALTAACVVGIAILIISD